MCANGRGNIISDSPTVLLLPWEEQTLSSLPRYRVRRVDALFNLATVSMMYDAAADGRCRDRLLCYDFGPLVRYGGFDKVTGSR